MSEFHLKNYLEERRVLVDQALEQYLPSEKNWPQELNASVRYSMMIGGKRLRPILALAAAEALGKSIEDIIPFACALEMIHTYSLIHDDLPAMDDDDLRRGKPTNHKVYGEAIAILAGDSLLTEAFSLITHHRQKHSPAVVLEIIQRIAEACGARGMVGGQVQDLMSEKKKLTLEELEHLHRHKTGKLFQVSLEVGALLSGANDRELESLSEYGSCIGLAFQIADDVLDIEGGVEIGKDIGSDLEKEKATYPGLLGLVESKALAKHWIELALEKLKIFGDGAEPLRALARYIVDRKH